VKDYKFAHISETRYRIDMRTDNYRDIFCFTIFAMWTDFNTVRFYVPQNAQNGVRYVPCRDAEKDLTRKLVIIFHITFPMDILTSLNVSRHVI
jgi:hypothetical protein